MFRKIVAYFSKRWADYQEQKKFDALYARLDRNKAGRFSMKEHRKMIEEQKHAQMKKNRDAANERKSVKGK
jgi:hypothetical protein